MTRVASHHGFDARTPKPRISAAEGIVAGITGLVTIALLLGTLLWVAGLVVVQQDLLPRWPAWWACAGLSMLALLVRAAWQATALSTKK